MKSESQELEDCRKEAGPWVLSLLDSRIRTYQAGLEAYERIGDLFKAEQTKIYLRALKIAREGAMKALESE